jgi:hypothetical protein
MLFTIRVFISIQSNSLKGLPRAVITLSIQSLIVRV